jgi:OHCU decarboxylase
MEGSINGGHQRLNSLGIGEAESELLQCCGSREWAARLIAERPFANMADLIAKADRVWWSLESPDWLEAFHSHPKIGESRTGIPAGHSEPESEQSQFYKWSENEQSGTRNSAPETMAALASLNREYEEKFGYIFIVCAQGKSSEEMLRILQDRLGNDRDEELHIAAAEQAQITRLRLGKLIDNRQS